MADGKEKFDGDSELTQSEGVDSGGERTPGAAGAASGESAQGNGAEGRKSPDVSDPDETVQQVVADAAGMPDRVRDHGVEGSADIATAPDESVSQATEVHRGQGGQPGGDHTGRDGSGAQRVAENGSDADVPVDEPGVDVVEPPRWPKFLSATVEAGEFQVGWRFPNCAVVEMDKEDPMLASEVISKLMRKGYFPSERIDDLWYWLRVAKRPVKDILNRPFEEKYPEIKPADDEQTPDDRSTPFFNSNL